MTRLAVMRPEPGASATVDRARRRGLDAVAMPLFTIEPVEWQAPDRDDFDGLLLTSANALRDGGGQLEQLRALPAYAVGMATAEVARAAGFDIAAAGDSGVDRLLGSIGADFKLLHLCGEDRREPVDALQSITPLIVYRSKEIDHPELHNLDGAVALIHSPRAGRRLAELVSERSAIAIAAISAAAAEAVGAGWRVVEAADEPGDDALLALAERLCNNLAR